MSNGKAFAVYVCQNSAYHRTYTDTNTHSCARGNLKLEHSSCIACS